MAEAFLISSVHPSAQQARVTRLLGFYGVNCVLVSGNRLSDIVAQLSSASRKDRSLCVVASGETLGDLTANEPDRTAVLEQFTRVVTSLFVFGFEPAKASELFLKAISAETLACGAREDTPDITYEVSANYPEITAELSGHSFRAVRRSGDEYFAKGSERSAEVLITANRQPFLCMISANQAKVFLSASSEVIDLDTTADDRFSFAEYFSRLMPILIYLKSAFGNQIWHSPNHSVANLVIDDPLLRPSYGFVNFESLVRESDEIDFTTTLAFIPWNHRRTNQRTVDLFRRRSDRLSICIHGCDHISAEFGITDLGKLNSTIQTSLSRVKDLEDTAGLPVAKSMVFPQGHFSSAAMLALKCNNFIAAVNTELLPMAGTGEEKLTAADFLDLAVTRYHGLALFRRRYPEDASEFPLQLFAGRPLFIVEHHEFFKNGFDRLTSMVESIKTITPKVRWTDLSEILTSSYQLRKAGENETHCRVYASSQILENREPTIQQFVVTKHEPHTELLKQVRANDTPVEFVTTGDGVQFVLHMSPLSKVHLTFEYDNPLPCPARKLSAKQRTKISVRRYLSEFRDNVIARNETLLSAATMIKNILSN